jgi:hypothetical protein
VAKVQALLQLQTVDRVAVATTSTALAVLAHRMKVLLAVLVQQVHHSVPAVAVVLQQQEQMVQHKQQLASVETA